MPLIDLRAPPQVKRHFLYLFRNYGSCHFASQTRKVAHAIDLTICGPGLKEQNGLVQLCPRLYASGRLLRDDRVRDGPLCHRQHRRRNAARTPLYLDHRQGRVRVSVKTKLLMT